MKDLTSDDDVDLVREPVSLGSALDELFAGWGR